MKRAVLLLKPSPHYRRDAFEAGLKRIGYTVVRSIDNPGPDDLLVSWNLFGPTEKLAESYRRHGAKVIVTENGYMTPPGRPGMYALSLDGHCGAGRFPSVEGSTRWADLGIPCKPWRSGGKYILVCGQRSIGSREMASPPCWHQKVAERLQRVTKLPIRVRPHPGRVGAGRPLDEDLKGAHAVVVWSSACGVKALTEGIPVHYAAPHWICSEAATSLSRTEDIETQCIDDEARMRALSRMADGQWTYEEIATGEPLQGVIECS